MRWNFLKASYGDCYFLYIDYDDKLFTILVDGGPKSAYVKWHRGRLVAGSLKEELKGLEKEKEDAVFAQEFERAGDIKRRQDKLKLRIEKIHENWEKEQSEARPRVSEDEIADVVSGWTRTAVSKAIRRGRVGLKDPKRPIGSFLFLGPTGVGKTELCKALAEALFGTENAMIRVDMSEYMEKHSVSKLIGSPPGYVGFEEGGQLSEKVRRNPYSVLLFDEIEKAHPDVFNILLQVLDDGQITDSQGRRVDFKNTVIIMTSNRGAESIVTPKLLGFGAKANAEQDYQVMKDRVMEAVRRTFRPEFLNRIDEIIVFHPLDRDNMKDIVNIMLKELSRRAKQEMGITLRFGAPAKELLIEKGYDPKYGARPLRRVIQNLVEDELAGLILDGTFVSGDIVNVGKTKDGLSFHKGA